MSGTVGDLRLRVRPGHPDFLDLPWSQALEAWDSPRQVEVARGVHRHVVRFVNYDDRLYALKELPRRLARREFELLRRMAEASLPVVEVIGVVERSSALDDVLVTSFLDYSLPYRTLFAHQWDGSELVPAAVESFSSRLLDALAMLLVRMHLAGFFWGDCSLSNTLFRRDAGALAAYIVDVETGEWHARLTAGQRDIDLEITEQNVAGGLFDLQAEHGVEGGQDPAATAAELRRRYERLWVELTGPEVILPADRYRIEERMRCLNDLGFDVDEIELVRSGSEDHIILKPVVTERGHHRRRLAALTGLRAEENQARSLLNDLANFRIAVEQAEGRALPESVIAYRWLNEVFEPTIAAVPEEFHPKREAAELFHEVIEHKWFLSERAARDVGIDAAVRSYLSTVLPDAADERTVLASRDDPA